jgi:hypothetical protein
MPSPERVQAVIVYPGADTVVVEVVEVGAPPTLRVSMMTLNGTPIKTKAGAETEDV